VKRHVIRFSKLANEKENIVEEMFRVDIMCKIDFFFDSFSKKQKSPFQMNFQRQFGELTSENYVRVWNTACHSLKLSDDIWFVWVSEYHPFDFQLGYALGRCDKEIEYIRLYIRLLKSDCDFDWMIRYEGMLMNIKTFTEYLDYCMNYAYICTGYGEYEYETAYDYFAEPILQKQNTLFELGSEIRTLIRTRSIEAELLERTLAPSRYLDWCVPSGEKEFIQSQFVREETCHTILKTGKRKGKYCGRCIPCRYHSE
jgi:hypothetical protein